MSNTQRRLENGLFGYYGLMSWYFNEFNEEDRARLRMAYGNYVMEIPFDMFIHGKEAPLNNEFGEMSAVGILTTLLSNVMFRGDYPIDLTEKIIVKIEALTSEGVNIVDCHFAYILEIDFYKMFMNTSPRYEQGFVQACLNQIAIASRVKEHLQKNSGRLPHHPGFAELQSYYEKKGRWDEAYALSGVAQKVWGTAVSSIHYGAWIESLLKKNDVNRAKEVLQIAIGEDPDKERWGKYNKAFETH